MRADSFWESTSATFLQSVVLRTGNSFISRALVHFGAVYSGRHFCKERYCGPEKRFISCALVHFRDVYSGDIFFSKSGILSLKHFYIMRADAVWSI